MRKRRQRPGLGEAESFPRPRPCIGASGEMRNLSVEGGQPSRSRARWRLMMLGSGEAVMFHDPLQEVSDEIGEWASMLTRLAGGPARGDLAHGSFLADVFLGWGKLVFDSWWIFILIWVPQIMVSDN
jgi:hypothetical protein